MKKKDVFKAVALIVPFIASTLIAFFGTKDVVVAFLLGACGLSYAWFLYDLGYGVFVKKDYSARAWQLRIYQGVVVGTWTLAVLSPTAWVISASLAVCVASILMFVGVKYDDKNGNGIPDILDKAVALSEKLKAKVEEKKAEIEEAKEEKVEEKSEIEKLEDKKYRPYEDIIGNCDDLCRPMCYYGGEAHSLNEAIADGQEEEANKALDYIASLKKETND